MDIVNLIQPHSNKTRDVRPAISACEWLQGIDDFYAAFLALSCVFSVIVLILACTHLYYVLKYVSNERIQTDLYYVVFMFPVATLCGLGGMFIPRAATFLYAVALAYFMLCLFIVVSLMFNLFGSRATLSAYLLEKNSMIKFQVPPLCCWCTFLPQFKPTVKNLRRVEWMVFQTPLVRIFLEIMNIVFFLELTHRDHPWFIFSNLTGLISMFVAFYGCYVMIPLGAEKLAPYRFGVIFRLVDIAQCFYTIQKFCFDFASSLGLIRSDTLLSPGVKAQFWTSFMLTWEMMLMSAIATYLLRPSKSALFDKYPGAPEHPEGLPRVDTSVRHLTNSSTLTGIASHLAPDISPSSSMDLGTNVELRANKIEENNNYVNRFDTI